MRIDGNRGANLFNSNKKTTSDSPTIVVGGCRWGIFRNVSHSIGQNLEAWSLSPKILFGWLNMMFRATPLRKPVRIGSERKSAMKPRRMSLPIRQAIAATIAQVAESGPTISWRDDPNKT